MFGLVTRYDSTASFTTAGSYTVFDTTTVSAYSKGFWGAVYDGKYVYFVPSANVTAPGQVTRIQAYKNTNNNINAGGILW